MITLKQKLFSLAGLSTFMTLLISTEIVQAVPLCYMVNQAGQMIDLSYMCNQNTTRTQPQETQQEGRTFSRRITVNNPTPQTPIRTYADLRDYVHQQRETGNDDSVWEDVNYYNRFLEFPSTMPRRTAIRQEISPRIVGSERNINFFNADSSYNKRPFTTRRQGDFSNISSQYVLNSRGILELRYYDLKEQSSLN